ncbi:MAG: hypothetical protein IJ381_04910 [Clostridia bacterium]|nr:hypothetical protein [Clostridia bacterium]
MKDRKKMSAYSLTAGMTLVFFVVQALIMRIQLAYVPDMTQALGLSALFALVYGGFLTAFVRLEKPERGTLAFAGAFAAVTMLARVAMLDFVTADYRAFLSGWMEVFRQGGVRMLAENVGDYNLMYQYVLLLASKVPLKDLYLIKWFSVVFDYALALAMMRAAGYYGGERAKLPVLLMMQILPTVLLDGACWGQCDSVYVFFIVMSLYWLETGKPVRSAAMLAISFAFKLQTIFFFPIVLLGLIHKRYKLRDAAVFAAAYLVTLLPAVMAGRPPLDALMVYVNQSMGQYYHRLVYGAPNLYIFFPLMELDTKPAFTWMRNIKGINADGLSEYLDMDLFPDLQHAALYACVLLVLIAVVYWLIHYREVTPDMTLEMALFFALFLPFVMPKMHERYYALADMLAILYACRHRNRRFMPLLVAGASLLSYLPYITRQHVVDFRVYALMMFAALIVVSRDLLVRMRKNRIELAKGGMY